MNRTISRLGLTASIIVAGGAIGYAQTSTTGAITGVVRDSDGAPIVGASVRIVSSQVTRNAVTGADGSYRFGLLNPGSWQISITKSGFTTINKSVDILTNNTSTLNLRMGKEGNTTVVVIGEQSAIDTSTTQLGLVTSMDNLAGIPKSSRDMNAIALLAPGVVSGGNLMGGISIGGGSAAENSFVVDGLTTTDFRRGFQGATMVTDFIDQIEVQTGGFKPEFSALGGVFNAITKSGSNETKGSAWFTWDAIGIQALPKRNLFFRQGDIDSRYDIGGEVSGFLIKDKLFYFAGVDANLSESPQSAIKPNNIGLIGTNRKADTTQFLAKINWYVAPDHQLTVSVNANNTTIKQNASYPTNGSANNGGQTKDALLNMVFNYDWSISPALFFSFKAGTTNDKVTFDPANGTDIRVTDNNWYATGPGRPGGPQPNPAGVPAGTAFSRGGAGFYTASDKGTTTQFAANLSWFVNNHSLKFGISQLESKYTEVNKTSGGERVTIRRSGTTGNFNGVNREFLSTDASVTALFRAIYAQDQWEAAPGFKLMYGFRFETQEQKDLHDKTFMKFNSFKDQVQPRLGFTWDVNNDGKSKLSGSYAKYFEAIPQRVAIRVYANETYLRYTYGRTNSTYNSNTGDYTIGVNPPSILDFATPFSFDPIAEGTKLPERKEYTLGFDQTLAAGLTVGVHGKHRSLRNPIEDSVITDYAGNYYDPGAPAAAGLFFGQAILWNPGHSAIWTSRPTSGTPSTRFVVNNTLFADNPGNNYDSLDFTVDYKTDRTKLSFSYTWSRLYGNYEGVVSSSNGQADGNITASFDYWPYVGTGLLPLDRTNVIKIYGSHRFTVWNNDLNVGFNIVAQDGTPRSLFDDGSTTDGNPPGSGSSLDVGGYGNAVPANFTLGQYGRNPSNVNTDVHLDYTMRFGTKVKFTPSVDILNFFNTRIAGSSVEQATGQDGSPNVTYGQENSWQLGRRYRFGLKVQF